MSFCFLYNVVLENHSVQNSPWGGLLPAQGLVQKLFLQCRSRSFFNLKPMSVIVYQFQTVRFIQMVSLTFGLFTQVSGSGFFRPSCL